jgi:hypothetical protein
MGPPEKAGPTPDQLGGRTGSGAGECNPTHLMGESMKRLARYGTAKGATLRTLSAVGRDAAINEGVRFDSVAACGDWLLFRHFPTLAETKLRSANFCSVHLVCGFCAIRRGARMMARYLERFALIRAKHPELQPFLVTFTVRNGRDLRERLQHLERSLGRLHKRRHGKRSQSLLRDIAAAVWSYEVTYSDANGWHPHVHAIWLAEREPDQLALRREWEDITVDSFMCDVRPIEASETTDADVDPHAKGFAEVFKYALKAAELPAAQVLESFRVLRGRRLVRSFGKFFGVKEPASDDLGDELPASELPYIDLLWRYRGGRYEHSATYDFRESSREGRDDASRVLRAEAVQLPPGDLRRADGRTGEGDGADARPLAHRTAHGAAKRSGALLRNLREAVRLPTPRGPVGSEG